MSTAPKTVLGIPRVEAPWLLYLCFLAFQPLFDPDSGIGDWLVIAASVAVFLPVYGFTHRVIGRRQFFRRAGVPGALIGIVAMLALGVLTTLFNSAGNVFIIYAAAAAGKLHRAAAGAGRRAGAARAARAAGAFRLARREPDARTGRSAQ
ncbi:MAG TPA: hypothetical protein PKN52_04045, partial [Trueperaceae bacterium]|nr:hypothetical protein [Trueperaceae bacterium]